MSKTAIIIGAGPAGLTAAYELLTHTDIIPIVLEAGPQVGGLSKTIDHNGNKIDIGGHRFFSKSKKVVDWWLHFLPLDTSVVGDAVQLHYQNKTASHILPDHHNTDTHQRMLLRPRKSRIYFEKKLYDYPLQPGIATIRRLGWGRSLRIFGSYLGARLMPRKPESSLEDFFINRFGSELYLTFFKDYTEKVWGVPCHQIPADWGRQRVKNLNIGKVIGHAIRSIFVRNTSLQQKGTSTSLIEQFLYPLYGPGQMWETVARTIEEKGGQILLNTAVTRLLGNGQDRVVAIETSDTHAGTTRRFAADYVLSTMPVRELLQQVDQLPVPPAVAQIADSLQYRDFLIVGILTDQLLLTEKNGSDVSDNWIYIQDHHIKAGRLQFFHNWSPGMVQQADSKWLGVEYFCEETEPFWQQPDEEISRQAIAEMQQIGILSAEAVKDTLVVRVKKAYPSYNGGYQHFDQLIGWFNTITNLYPIGRNGMHRYNNTDHSMLTAMAAVDAIVSRLFRQKHSLEY
ncbi:MAG: NAD(P)/FAD-dependent oxidoreductase [Chitinophagaceae bacterium]